MPARLLLLPHSHLETRQGTSTHSEPLASWIGTFRCRRGSRSRNTSALVSEVNFSTCSILSISERRILISKARLSARSHRLMAIPLTDKYREHCPGNGRKRIHS